MSMKQNDIMAFPSPSGFAFSGMTLRDWFAGQALAGGWATKAISFSDDTIEQERARQVYAIADAMLAERAKVQP